MNKLDFNEVFSIAWKRMLAQVGPAILWTLVYILILAVLYITIIGWIILPAWGAAYLLIVRKLYHGEPVVFKDINVPMEKLGQLWIAAILFELCVAIGGYLLIIPGVVFCVLWSMTFFLIIDKDMNAVSAMKASWERILKDFWTMLSLMIAAGIIFSLGAFALGIGILFTLPFATLVMWAAYYVLFPKAEDTPSVPSQDTPSVPLQ